jgi:hypothetical protein
MGPATSPNEPLFFLHHANVDRAWAKVRLIFFFAFCWANVAVSNLPHSGRAVTLPA